jgi:hypothetical protein
MNMMIRLSLLVCLAALAVPASGQTLYGAIAADNGPSDLFTLNPATGALVTTIGPIGFAVTGLAFNPLTGVLYGATARIDGTSPHSLITINTTTGAGTLVGSFNLGTETLADITFTSDGTLYGWTQPNTDSLATVNLTTGAATVVGPSGLLNTFGSGIAADASNTLYFAGFGDQGDLNIINKATGLPTFVVTLTGTADEPINAMAFHPGTGLLYAVVRNTGLATINTTTGAVTVLGPTVDSLDAIAFSGGVTTPTPTNTPTSTPTNTPTNTPIPVAAVVPTLSSRMLGLLGLMLAAVALFVLRRF